MPKSHDQSLLLCQNNALIQDTFYFTWFPDLWNILFETVTKITQNGIAKIESMRYETKYQTQAFESLLVCKSTEKKRFIKWTIIQEIICFPASKKNMFHFRRGCSNCLFTFDFTHKYSKSDYWKHTLYQKRKKSPYIAVHLVCLLKWA